MNVRTRKSDIVAREYASFRWFVEGEDIESKKTTGSSLTWPLEARLVNRDVNGRCIYLNM